MEISLASFNELDQDKTFHDSVTRRFDRQKLVIRFVENSESVAKIILDLAFSRDSNLVLFSLLFFFGDFRETYVCHWLMFKSII